MKMNTKEEASKAEAKKETRRWRVIYALDLLPYFIFCGKLKYISISEFCF